MTAPIIFLSPNEILTMLEDCNNRRVDFIDAIHEYNDSLIIAAVNELPFVDDFSLPGYDYLGTRCMVRGGEVCELGKQEGDETIPF